MGYKIRVPSTASAGKILVPGLGAFVPNEWTEISDEAVARYEVLKDRPIKESALEVKTTKKKESE